MSLNDHVPRVWKSLDLSATSLLVQVDRETSEGSVQLKVQFIAILISVLLIDSAVSQTPSREVTFGLNSFLGNLRHSELRPPTVKITPEDRTAYLDMVRALGVTSIRETFMNWAEIEPDRNGGYTYSDFDDFARKASDRDIEVIALLYPFPPWATGQPVGQVKKDYVSLGRLPLRRFEANFRSFVRNTVERYCGCKSSSLSLKRPIRHWIFFNEPDVLKISPDEYAYWLKIFYEEVKRSDASAKVLAPAVATAGLAFGKPRLDRIDPAFLAKLLQSKELSGPKYPYFDILNFHNYPVFYGEETGLYSMNAAYGYVRKVLNEHKLGTEVWLTETGDNSPDAGLQADRAVKLLVHAASVGVNRVHLHGLWDYVEPELWGVLENSPSGTPPVRKPSFFAFQTLLRKIGKNLGVDFLGPGRYRVLLSTNESVYVLWAEGPNTEAPHVLTGQLLVTDTSGKIRRIPASELELTEHPIFVERSRMNAGAPSN
jgi:hypothetical protein